MICPQCQSELEPRTSNCPACGVRIVRNISGIVKTSTVLIATEHENSFYRSVQDVPEGLRRQLIETTNSENSGMIVIADRAGKEQWTEIVAHRESRHAQEVSHSSALEEGTGTKAAQVRGFAGLSWAAWAGVMLFLAAATMIASVFQVFRW